MMTQRVFIWRRIVLPKLPSNRSGRVDFDEGPTLTLIRLGPAILQPIAYFFCGDWKNMSSLVIPRWPSSKVSSTGELPSSAAITKSCGDNKSVSPRSPRTSAPAITTNQWARDHHEQVRLRSQQTSEPASTANKCACDHNKPVSPRSPRTSAPAITTNQWARDHHEQVRLRSQQTSEPAITTNKCACDHNKPVSPRSPRTSAPAITTNQWARDHHEQVRLRSQQTSEPAITANKLDSARLDIRENT